MAHSGWLAMQYERLAARAERDGQYSGKRLLANPRHDVDAIGLVGIDEAAEELLLDHTLTALFSSLNSDCSKPARSYADFISLRF